MKFRNDKERIAFLEDYRNDENGWYLWQEYAEIGRKMWRRDIDDGNTSVIVEERLQTISWPRPEEKWIVHKWYLVTDVGRPFEDNVASRTVVLDYIRQLKNI